MTATTRRLRGAWLRLIGRHANVPKAEHCTLFNQELEKWNRIDARSLPVTFPALLRSAVLRSGFAFGRLITETRRRQVLTQYGPHSAHIFPPVGRNHGAAKDADLTQHPILLDRINREKGKGTWI